MSALGFVAARCLVYITDFPGDEAGATVTGDNCWSGLNLLAHSSTLEIAFFRKLVEHASDI
jgi:hypothetical protein